MMRVLFLLALQKIFNVLSDTGTESAVFTNALPKGEQEVCAVLVLEQKVDLINEDEAFASGAGMPFRNGAEVLGEDFHEADRSGTFRYTDAEVMYLDHIVLGIHGIVDPADRRELVAVRRYGELHVARHPYP